MKNLAKKLLNALKHTKNLDGVQSDIEKYQSDLLKNINSSLLDNREKNKLLKVYMDLQDVGKSLYKYDVLMKNNNIAAAQEEKDEIKNKVLKGHIYNIKYVWRSEHGEHTCDECEGMDGEEFYSYEDIPPQPHPNCKCYVEVLECPYEPEYSSDDEEDEDYGSGDGDERSSDGVPQSRQDKSGKSKDTQPQKQNEEPCDCWKLAEAIEQLIEYAENLRKDLTAQWNESVNAVKAAINDLNNKYWQKRAEIEEDIIMKQWEDADNLFGDALRNMYELRQDIGSADKFYHAKAHCETAQRESEIQSAIMTQAGNIRESVQFVEHKLLDNYTLEQALRDMKEDLEANEVGKQLGKEFPNRNCENMLDFIYYHTKQKQE